VKFLLAREQKKNHWGGIDYIRREKRWVTCRAVLPELSRGALQQLIEERERTDQRSQAGANEGVLSRLHESKGRKKRSAIGGRAASEGSLNWGGNCFDAREPDALERRKRKLLRDREGASASGKERRGQKAEGRSRSGLRSGEYPRRTQTLNG